MREEERRQNFPLDLSRVPVHSLPMNFSTRLSRPQILLVTGLILAVAAYRVLHATLFPGLPNFSPVMALAFCGGLFLPGVLAWIVPVAAVALGDVGLAIVKDYPLFGPWQIVNFACLAAAVGAGRLLARRESFGLGSFLALLISCGVGFYLVSNAVSWLALPEYAKTLSGFIQAQTVGLPGWPPTWTFLRNSLISDLIFGGLILAVRASAARSDVEFAKPLHIEVRDQAGSSR
jgi:hypothetical protein